METPQNSPIGTRGFTLFPWQRDAVEAWARGDARGPYRGTLEVFTGGGKTLLALEAIARAARLRPDLRVAVVVPTQALAAQWRAELLAHTTLTEADLGQLGGGRHDTWQSRRVLVCVLNSAAAELPQQADAAAAERTMLVVDECHRAGARTFSNVLRVPAAFRLGLSATPDREELDDDGEPLRYDEQILGRELGDVVFSFDLRRARELGWLPEFTIHHHGVTLTDAERREYETVSRRIDDYADQLRGLGIDTALARRVAGRGDEVGSIAAAYVAQVSRRKDLLYRAVERPRVVRLLLERLLEREQTPRVLLFHERVDEAAALAEQLAGVLPVPVAVEHSRLAAGKRRAALAAFASGAAPVLMSVKSLVEGINVPAADVGVSVASTASVRQRVQSLGRVLRRPTDGEAKTAEMHMLYVADTVDELIYAKEDWSDLTGPDANRYWLWAADADSPTPADGPPASPRPTEDQEWERLGQSAPTTPVRWLGLLPEREYSVDSRGNVSSASGAAIVNGQGVAAMVRTVRGSAGGRFRVTPKHRLVIVTRPGPETSEAFVAGALTEAFRVADDSPEVGASAADVAPGQPYPGPATAELGSYRIRAKSGGVIERRQGSSREFALADAASTDQRERNAAGLLEAWRALDGTGLQFSINSLGHAWYRSGGTTRFLADVTGGLRWPTDEHLPTTDGVTE